MKLPCFYTREFFVWKFVENSYEEKLYVCDESYHICERTFLSLFLSFDILGLRIII